jgi:uncharacterized membrane protein HdeD (DUF308 family)
MDFINEHKRLFTFEGIVFVLLGILAIAFPVIFTFGFTIFLGWLFLIGGVVGTFRAIQMWNTPGIVASLLSALLAIIIGILLLVNPWRGVLTLTLLLTIFFFIEGVFKIAYAISMKGYPNWGWLLFSGLIALVMGAIILSGWPGTALWVIGLLVGIDLLFFGISLLSLVYSQPKNNIR